MENKTKVEFNFSGIGRTCDVALVRVPDFKLLQTTKWMKYGDDNAFPQELVRLSTVSPTHGQLLNLLATGIAGRGWTGNQTALDFLATLDEDNDENMLARISAELSIFNGFSIQAVWGKGAKKITNIYPIPFQNVRAAQIDETGWVGGYYLSVDWENHMKYKPTLYSSFNPDGNIIEGAEQGSQVLYVRVKHPASPIYPLPRYASALTSIATDAALDQFMFSIVDNCFMPGVLFTLPPDPDADHARAVERKLMKSYSGPNRAGKPMFYRQNEAQDEIKVQELGKGVDSESYQHQVEIVQQRIVTAHDVKSPTLAGLSSGSGLSSTGDEIKAAYAIFQSTTVHPYQQLIIKAFKRILKVNGIPADDLGIMPFDPLAALEGNVTSTTTNQ